MWNQKKKNDSRRPVFIFILGKNALDSIKQQNDQQSDVQFS